ncbi:MAG: hypothetical protein R6V73_08585, partial [Anaerolineales bacterium]
MEGSRFGGVSVQPEVRGDLPARLPGDGRRLDRGRPDPAQAAPLHPRRGGEPRAGPGAPPPG